jgi:hypothetical protein
MKDTLMQQGASIQYCKWEDDIKMDLEAVGCEGVDYVAQVCFP